MAKEEEGTGTELAGLQSWPVPNRECVDNTEMKNGDAVPLHSLEHVCRKNGTKNTLEIVHCLTVLIPECLLSVLRREGNITKW